MEKVKLPREVAEALDYAKEKLNWSDANILVRTCRKDWESCNMESLNAFCRTDNDRLTIAKALVIGYEVEKTKEDKVREVISSFCNGAIVSEWVIEDIKKIYEGTDN